MRPGDAQPRRVAILGAFPPQAQGIADYCGELARALSLRWEVLAIGFQAMYPRWLYPGGKAHQDVSKADLKADSLRVDHRLTYYDPLGWMASAMGLRPDIFHAQWWSLPLWPVYLTHVLASRLRGVPVVLTLHNVRAHGFSGAFRLATAALCRLARRVLVHCPANAVEAAHVYRLDPARVAVVPMPAYASVAHPISRDDARRALRLPAASKLILLFGALRSYKGIDDLLRALRIAGSALSNVELVIAGKAWMDIDPSRRLARELGIESRVHLFADYVPEERAALFFSACDLVVLPYRRFSAQSAVGAQCIPYRKPLIVTAVGGLPEWVEDDARRIVPPADPDALAAAIIDHFVHEAERHDDLEAASTRILESHSPGAVAGRHVEVYEACLGRPGR